MPETGLKTRLRHTIIKFPVTAKQVRVAQRDFFAVAGFPQVVGAVDGTHVGIHGCNYTAQMNTSSKNRHGINVRRNNAGLVHSAK